jgi:hypothetical protein
MNLDLQIDVVKSVMQELSKTIKINRLSEKL